MVSVRSRRLSKYQALLPAMQRGYRLESPRKNHPVTPATTDAGDVQERRVALETSSSDPAGIPQHHRSPGACRDQPLASLLTPGIRGFT